MRRVYCYELRRYLEVPERVERVVSLTPSVTAVMADLGFRESIVGVSPWCRLLREYGVDVPDAPIVGSYASISVEVLKRLEPDLVLLAGGYQLRIVEDLERAGVRYFVTRLPRGLEVLEFPIEVSYAVGRVERGFELARRGLEGLWRAREVVESLGLRGARVLVAMMIGSDFVLPGIASHVVQCLGAAGLRVLNDRVEASYVWGEQAEGCAAELCADADLILYQLPTLHPREGGAKLPSACVGKPILVLPVLALSDYSHLFLARLSKIVRCAANALERRGGYVALSASDLRIG
ncbi:MAG: ABC transporter substrate-binding protein [Crenarchaeota archaeon]|nr:ABC transporter substrate-binding protein [Thermoproteota archaeon]